MKIKWTLLLVGFLTLGVALAGCAEPEEAEEEEETEPVGQEDETTPAEDETGPGGNDTLTDENGGFGDGEETQL